MVRLLQNIWSAESDRAMRARDMRNLVRRHCYLQLDLQEKYIKRLHEKVKSAAASKK